MLIRKAPDFRYSDITPKRLYMNRRRFLAAAAIGSSLVGRARAANPPLHRFRVGLEFAFSGHRQLDGMITQHGAAGPDTGRACRIRSGTGPGR